MVEADGNNTVENDGIKFYPGTVINNSEGDAFDIFNVGDVTITVIGASESDGAASLTGLTGIYASEGDQLTINNYGHVQGTESEAIYVTGIGQVTVNNHSYTSSIGATNGDSFIDDHQVLVHNQGGLTAGLSDDGLYFDTIDGASPASGSYAVDVQNGASNDGGLTDGGIIAGSYDGIYATNIGQVGPVTGLRVNNSALYDSESGWIPGGLISGGQGSGIEVNSLAGNLYIDNKFTMEGSLDLTSPAIDSEGADLLAAAGLPSGFTTGIYGLQNGIYAAAALPAASTSTTATARSSAPSSTASI